MGEDSISSNENFILDIDIELLFTLLVDRSSGKNLIWATNNYIHKGYGYESTHHMSVQQLLSRNGIIIKPRMEKSKREQTTRIRDKAEVFTPSWVCNAQNNLVDEAWFERKDVFNVEKEKTWTPSDGVILFPSKKNWKDYVLAKRLEISCGEAPYLVSRYDAVNGNEIPLNMRIGLLDRKMRIVNENTKTEGSWITWTKKAFQSVYGYDWQGDNVFLSRKNLLLTYGDYYAARFKKNPTSEQLREIAEIISWNIWQMDGLHYVIPYSNETSMTITESFDSGGAEKNKDTGIYCKIKDWEKDKTIRFISLLKGEKK